MSCMGNLRAFAQFSRDMLVSVLINKRNGLSVVELSYSFIYKFLLFSSLNVACEATGFLSVLAVRSHCIRLVSEHNDGSEGCPSELGKERQKKCQKESNP